MTNRGTYPLIVRDIGSCVFTDYATVIPLDDIVRALEEDRNAGFRDPTFEEALALVEGREGQALAELAAAHPALDALLRVHR